MLKHENKAIAIISELKYKAPTKNPVRLRKLLTTPLRNKKPSKLYTETAAVTALLKKLKANHRDIQAAYVPDTAHSSPNTFMKKKSPNINIKNKGTRDITAKIIVVFTMKS